MVDPRCSNALMAGLNAARTTVLASVSASTEVRNVVAVCMQFPGTT
jgi:hypothetical protein